MLTPETKAAAARIVASRAHRFDTTARRLLVEDALALLFATKPEEIAEIRAHIEQTVKEAA